VHDTSDEEAVPIKEANTDSSHMVASGQTGELDGQGHEAKYDEVTGVTGVTGGTGGTGDSDDEDSQARARRLGAASGDAPVYHIHYQEDSQNQDPEDGAGHVQPSGLVPESPQDGTGNSGGVGAPAKNSGALVWL